MEQEISNGPVEATASSPSDVDQLERMQRVRDDDHDVVANLDRLRVAVIATEDRTFTVKWRDEPVEALEERLDPLTSSVLRAVRAGGRVSMAALVEWLDGKPRGDGDGSPADIAECCLTILAHHEPSAVLDVLAPLRSALSLGVLSRIAGLHPREALAFVRRSHREAAYWRAVVALTGLEKLESVREQVREVATAIALDAQAEGSRGIALMVLLHLPNVAPDVWRLVDSLPQRYRRGLPPSLGFRVRDGHVEALDVLERWMREPSVHPLDLDHICEGLGQGLDTGDRAPPPLPEEVQERLVRDVTEAWRRGASAGAAARAVECALCSGRSDEEYASLGLDALASALAGADARSRHTLMYAASSPPARSAAWSLRLIERIAEVAELHEKAAWVARLARDYTPPDPWCKAAMELLLARVGPSTGTLA